ncbi:hypothetical protein GCM10027188_08140 [Lysobacter humi (ex Lee et al. 2017)]
MGIEPSALNRTRYRGLRKETRLAALGLISAPHQEEVTAQKLDDAIALTEMLMKERDDALPLLAQANLHILMHSVQLQRPWLKEPPRNFRSAARLTLVDPEA